MPRHGDGGGPVVQATPVAERAAALERAAGLMEAQMDPLVGLIVREAGRPSPMRRRVREAVDFLRYYALEARVAWARATMSVGRRRLHQPWNFPLAIFTGRSRPRSLPGTRSSPSRPSRRR